MLLLALCFLTGVCGGPVLAGHALSRESEELAAYLQAYLQLEETASSSLWDYFFLYFRYPVLALLAGLSPTAPLLLAAAAMAQGFFLSYSVSCFAGVLGKQGILLAAAGFGLRVLLVLPCFFLLAVPGVSRGLSVLLPRRGIGKTAEPSRGRLWSAALCGPLLCLGALLDHALAPVLLRFVCAYF